jgi:hypothetical protein
MAIIIRALVVLLLDLFICYLCGRLFLQLFYKKLEHPFSDVLMGFLLLQIGFEVLTLLFFWRGGGLAGLSYTWLAVVLILCIVSWIKVMTAKREKEKKLPRHEIRIVILTLLVVVGFCYYVSVNGQVNDDSRYYIALVNTTLNTKTLFRYNPYNGIEGGARLARRAVTTFEIHSAMLCFLFRIPALVVTRIMRASQNVILTSMAVYLCGKQILFRKDDNAIQKSCKLVIVNLLLQMIFAGTAYTSATFLLFRSYEGKAFAANALAIYTLYICAEIMRQKQKRNFLFVIILIWGAVAISTSGMVVISIEAALLLISFALTQMVRKRMENRYAKC